MDQNITTVLTTLITVLGTLGGAILGVVLSNRHTLRLEILKEKQEKAKRDIEVIKEVYLLLTKLADIFTNNIWHKGCAKDGLEEEIGKVKTLVRLFLPSVVPSLDSWSDVIDDLDIRISLENLADMASNTQGQGTPERLSKKWISQIEAQGKLRESQAPVYAALEELVR